MRPPNCCEPLRMITGCLLSVWCIFSALSVQSLPDPAHRHKASFLQSSGFRIHARIDVWQMDSVALTGQVELIETYSVANERSVVELRIPSDSGLTDRKYYVNGSDKQVIMVESSGKSCQAEDKNDMLANILSYMTIEPRRRFIEKWTQPIESVPDYVMGVARILHYVDQNRDQMKMTIVQSIRERKSNRYAMDSPFGKDVTMSVSLAQSAFNTWNGAELPLRVWLKSDNFGLVMIDFFLVEPLASHTPLEDTEYYLDPTTVELGLKCLAPAKQNLVMPFSEIYSMTADVVDVLDDSIPIRRFFLAYDGKQMAFRRDVLHEDGSPSTLTIYDFQRQLKFNIKHPRQDFSGLNADLKPKLSGLGDTIKAKAAQVNCVAAVSTGERATLFSIPYSELVHMGSGTVRGIEVDIYESYSYQQPHLFFPPASYTNRAGEWQLQAETLNAMNNKFGQQYSAIYYFARTVPDSLGAQPNTMAAAGETTVRAKDARKVLYARFGQLIRVDLMMGGRLLKKVNVYDFAWQLADGPNADRQETLFSVPGVCFRDAATSSAASKISQQLTMRAQLDFSDATHKEMTEQDAMVLLDNPVVRYKALARGLSAHLLELSSSRFLEISSSMTKFDKQPFQMHTSIKLSLAETDAWHPNWAGTYVQLWPRRQSVEGATNFDECFFEAVRRRRSGELLFAFIRDECFIDEAPIYEVRNNELGVREIEFTYSSVFRINRLVPSPHLAMRLELVRSKGRTRASKYQDKVYGGLMEKHVILPVVDTLHPKWLGESIVFKVSKLEFASRRGDQVEEGAEDASAQVNLNGLVLMTGHEVEQSSDGEDMSYEICRATCLMDLACRSYSVCARGLSTTCRTSEVDFSDGNLISELGPRLTQARAVKSTGVVSPVSFEYQPKSVLELQAENSNDKQNGGEAQPKELPVKIQVNLGFDKRCRVYKKRALDMFLEQPRSVGLLNSKVILEVDNEEECAKHCLDNNIQFFSRAPDVGLQSNTNDKQDSDEIKNQHRRRMSKWCAMFKYLNLKTSSDGKKLLAQLPEQKKDAICVLSKTRGGNMRVKTSDKEVRAKAEMDTFEFEYVNLYEPIRNFQMSFKEELVLQAGADAPRRKLAEMGSPEECARACFTQTVDLEPYCKSFEFVELTTDAGSTSEEMGEGSVRVTTLCAFNSISLHDAFVADVYDQVVSLTNDPQAVVTFYEPRKAYMMNDTVMKRLIGSAPNRPASESGGFGLFLIMILALASGVALGVWAKGPLVEHWANRHNNEDSIARRRFSNSVELGAQDGD